MKRYLHQIILLAGSAMIMLSSCIKEQAKVTFGGGTAPVLTSSATDSIPLPVSDTTANAVTFNWTNPDYTFSDGASSLNVNYYLEIDTLGANFTSPHMQQVGINSSLSTTFTVSAFNDLLTNGLRLGTEVPHTIELRIVSFIPPLSSSSPIVAALYSDSLTYMVTPYEPPPAINPPPTGELFVVGDATPQGWLPTGGSTTQQLTAVPGSNGLQFSITIQLNGSGSYKFIGNNNSYTYQYTVAVNDDPTEVNGGAFVSGGSNNIMAPAKTGNYTILVNFQTGTFTVTAQ